jgi:HSP20 family protein
MSRPNIKTKHEQRFRHRFISPANNRYFLGHDPIEFNIDEKKPAANFKQDGAHFEIEIAMPGFLKEEIHVIMFDDILTVRGEKTKEENPTSKYIAQEFDVDVLERQFKLSKEVVHEKINAKYDNGVLKLTFMDVFTEEDQPLRRVQID